MNIKGSGIAWMGIVPTIMSLFLLGTGIYLTIVIIKALIIYFKEKS